MKNTYLILLTTKMYFLIVECALSPDINLEGRLIANNDSKILQLSCTTNIAVHLCTVEFLIDKRTHNNLRYHDNNCYHTMSICSHKVCKCSGDCMSFTLNVTVTKDMMNYIYSCASKIENKGVIYSANISVIQDGNGGSTIIQKIVNTSNIMSPPQQATTISPDIDTVVSFSVPLIIVGAASGLLFLVIFFSVMAIIWKMYFKEEKDFLTGNSAQQDKAPDPSIDENRDETKEPTQNSDQSNPKETQTNAESSDVKDISTADQTIVKSTDQHDIPKETDSLLTTTGTSLTILKDMVHFKTSDGSEINPENTEDTV